MTPLSHRWRWLKAVTTVLVALASAPTQAAEPTAPANAPGAGTLRVLIKPAKPFAFQEDGQWKGYSVDLWKAIAQKNQWRYEWVPVETVPQMLDGLQAKQADVAVGALSVTEEREKVLDFSHAFYESGLQLVTLNSAAGSIMQAIGGLMSAPVLGGLGVLVLCLVLVSWLLWLLERRHNEDNFPKPAGAGLKESLWWSTNILIAGGCENISPTGTPGRLVAVVWMLGGIAFTSYITAVFTSTLTVSQLNTEVRGLQDLQGQVIATLAGSSSDTYLSAKGMPFAEHSTLDDAMGALLNKEAKAVLYDAPMIKHWLMSHPKEAEQVSPVGDLLAPQAYAFALPVGSDKRKAINAALLDLRASGSVEEANRRWFGTNVPHH